MNETTLHQEHADCQWLDFDHWQSVVVATGSPAPVAICPLDVCYAGANPGADVLKLGSMGQVANCVAVFGRTENARVVASRIMVDKLFAWVRTTHLALARDIEQTLCNFHHHNAVFAGLALNRPQVMGIVNVTPDSFSDGGEFYNTADAVAHGLALAKQGATILDVGGESTRPGARPVPVDEEIARIVPVIKQLAARGLKVSADTRHAKVMAAAIQAGAAIINDVSALEDDPESIETVAETQIPVVLMHKKGQPETMQNRPCYNFAPLEIYTYLASRVQACLDAGISRSHIAVDPGIGFGKTLAHNLQILKCLPMFAGLGCPVLLGASRKSFIGMVDGSTAASQRFGGSVAATLAGINGAAVLHRVHDVGQTCQAIAVWDAIRAQKV